MDPIQLSSTLLFCISLFVVNVAAVSNQTDSHNQLDKRVDAARFSFYDVGLGACGAVSKASDFIVAMNQPQFSTGNWCFKTISIHYGGKTAQAQVMDMCPGCPYGGLDFSRGLFDFFASEGAGIIYGSWEDGQQAHREAPRPSRKKAPPKPASSAKKKPSVIEEDLAPSLDNLKLSSLGSMNVAANNNQAPGSGNALKQLYTVFIGFGSLQTEALRSKST